MTRPNVVRTRAGCWLAAACVAAVALVTHGPGRRQVPGANRMESWVVADMRARLRERLPHFHQTADAADDSEAGFYLTATPCVWESLNLLPRVPERAARWRGVVHCVRYGSEIRPAVEEWGGCALTAGPFLFFGDPALLAEVREALRE